MTSPNALKLLWAPVVAALAEYTENFEIVLVTPPTTKLSPVPIINEGEEPGSLAAQNPRLFEVVTPPAPVAKVAVNAIPASSG